MGILLAVMVALTPRPQLAPVGVEELGRLSEIEHRLCRAGSAATPGAGTADIVPGRFAVGFAAGELENAAAWVRSRGGEVVRVSAAGGDFLVASFATDVDAERLAREAEGVPAVRYFEPDLRVRASFMPDDPYFLTHQWDKWVMYADLAWDSTKGSSSVTVAVIDNGVDYAHPDLAARFVPGSPGHDFVGNDDDPAPDDPDVPGAFHGTHVSGIIGATINNGEGIAGWAACRLMAVRALNDSGSGDMTDVADAILWATNNGADIVNMSLGAGGAITALIDACEYAVSSDVLLVAAAGNEGSGDINYPAALDECVCVGATDESSGLASFSNYGAQQELVAPGTTIVSSAPGGEYWLAAGTSMATPQVVGVAALVLSADGQLPASRIRAILGASAIDKGALGRDSYYGYGLVNAARAVQLAGLAAPRVSERGGSRGWLTCAGGSHRPPGWVEAAVVYDGLGRRVSAWAAGQADIVLAPGTYFVRATGADRAGSYRLLAVR